MELNTLRLLIILLICRNFIPSTSIPISRTRNLLHESKEPLLAKNMNQMASAVAMESELIEDRMDVQIHDYPPTGANPYHTPKPPHP